jgi:hypothetical protein
MEAATLTLISSNTSIVLPEFVLAQCAFAPAQAAYRS